MIVLQQAVIVEGRYDKIRLHSLIDGLILETNGFRIFKDREKLAFIRAMAHQKGIIILTDSDTAGFRIRRYIQSAIPPQDRKNLYQAYIPEILGKEKRKSQPSKAGTLGVEGMPTQVLVDALKRAGVPISGETEKPREKPVSKADFFQDGLTGSGNSSGFRREIMSRMGLPSYLSANALLDVINSSMSRKEYDDMIAQVKKELLSDTL